MAKAEVKTDGTVVWVNCGETGGALGRFSPRGIDVHSSPLDQVEGKPTCVACTHTEPGMKEWELFVELMKDYHQVVVPDAVRPKWLPEVSGAVAPFAKLMSPQEEYDALAPSEKVAVRAVHWFTERCPPGCPPEEHLANPTLGCDSEGERLLAEETAAFMMSEEGMRIAYLISDEEGRAMIEEDERQGELERTKIDANVH